MNGEVVYNHTNISTLYSCHSKLVTTLFPSDLNSSLPYTHM